MKKIFTSFLFIVAVVSFVDAADPKIKEGIRAIKHFEKTWNERLVRKVKDDSKGIKAIAFCNSRILNITKEVGKMYDGVKLKRVSLENRNPLNTPDKIDIPILREFDNMVKKRKRPKIKIVSTKTSYRIYKPLRIITPLCLKCHGSQRRMHKGIKRVLSEKYPNDRARNFRYREVRGAIVAIVKK